MEIDNCILRLYGSLDNIALTLNDENDINVDLKDVSEKFDTFFMETQGTPEEPEKERDQFKRLREKHILNGTIKDKHRENIPPHEYVGETPVDGETLFFRAVSIPADKNSRQGKILNKINRTILENCPWMIDFCKKSDDYEGLTPVHLAILKKDSDVLKAMAKSVVDYREKHKAQNYAKDLKAEGKVFHNTAMMAGTTLGVAALKFDEKIFCIVLKYFSSGLDVTNEKGDNIVHSLIKYAHGQPHTLSKVIEMLRCILDCTFFETLDQVPVYKESIEDKVKDKDKDKDKVKYRKQALKLLMMKNKEKLTPLQLAAKRQQFQIFELIMQSRTYRHRQSAECLFNEEIYDITEIETLELTEDVRCTEEERIKTEYHESILQYLIHHRTKSAFQFINFLPVKEVVRTKWKYYRWMCMGWFALHLVFMTMLTVAAVVRSQRIDPLPDDAKIVYQNVLLKNGFVTAVAVWGLIFGIFYLAIEVRILLAKRFQYWPGSNFLKCIIRHLGTPYSNLIFRVYFALLSLLLISDFAFGVAASKGSLPGYENYCLIFSVIIGWYLVMFFIQTIKAFSFFTVLIQRVFTDMVKFAVVMGILLTAFSAAMFMIMQGAKSDNENDLEDFKHFGKTMVKMLNIMLGIGDLDVFFTARSPVLAIIVFVLFVLLTTILLLNALIAMMSNSCTDLMSNFGGCVATKMHSRLQKLSVIFFLEGFLPYCLCKPVGTTTKQNWYENNEWVHNQQRRIWRKSFVGDNQKKGTEDDKENEFISDSNDGILRLIKQQFDRKKKGKAKRRKPGKDANKVASCDNIPDTISKDKQAPDIKSFDADICESCKQPIQSRSQKRYCNDKKMTIKSFEIDQTKSTDEKKERDEECRTKPEEKFRKLDTGQKEESGGSNVDDISVKFGSVTTTEDETEKSGTGHKDEPTVTKAEEKSEKVGALGKRPRNK